MNEQFDANGLYDIYSVWHLPFWQTRAFFLSVGILSALTICLCVWLIYRFVVRKQQKGRPAWQVALEALKQLQAKSYENKEEGKYTYFELSHVLKKYLAARYSIPIESQTDQELLASLEESQLPPVVKETLIGLGHGVELIKFANQEAVQEQIQRDINQAMQMVMETMPVENKKSQT